MVNPDSKKRKTVFSLAGYNIVYEQCFFDRIYNEAQTPIDILLFTQ